MFQKQLQNMSYVCCMRFANYMSYVCRLYELYELCTFYQFFYESHKSLEIT